MILLIGLLGVLFIIGFNSIANLFTSNVTLFFPKLVVILAVLGYVLSSIFAYNLKSVHYITLTTFVTISAAITSIPFMIYFEIKNFSNVSFTSLVSLIYLGVFPTAIAFLLRFYIISKSGPTFLSYVSYLIPIFAILWGYIFLGEKISLTMLIGLFFVLISIYFSQKNFNVKKDY